MREYIVALKGQSTHYSSITLYMTEVSKGVKKSVYFRRGIDYIICVWKK